MQDLVTGKIYQKNRLLKLVMIIIVILIIVIVVVLGFYFKSKSYSEFAETKYYFLVAKKSKNSKEITNMQDSVKSAGGAGIIYQKNNYDYLIITVYNDESAANEVLKLNKEKFNAAEILEIKTKRLKKSKKNQIKSCFVLDSMVKNLNKTIDSVMNYMMQYLKQGLTDNKLCSNVLVLRFEFDELLKRIDEIDDEKLKSFTYSYLNLAIMYFSNFINNFFGSTKKQSVLCDFVVNLVFLKIEIFNNL